MAEHLSFPPAGGRPAARRRRAGPSVPLTPESLRDAVAALLGERGANLSVDDDLIGRGADSLTIIRLATAWRRQGVELSFADLLERPTLSAWWSLIAARIASTKEHTPSSADDADVDESAPFDLTPMQQAYGIGGRDDQVLGSMTAHYYVEIDGTDIHPDRLERSVKAVAARHGMLRVRFLPDGRQQIMPQTPWRGVTIHDLRERTADDVAECLRRMRAELSHRRLAVDRGEVFDVQLSVLPGGATRVHVDTTMLVCDARSFQIILDDLSHSYRTSDPLPRVGYSFPRYLAERSRRRASTFPRDQEYWRSCIADLPDGPALPLAVSPAVLRGAQMMRRSRFIAPEQKQLLMQAAREHRLSLPVVLMTAFAEAIGAWSSEPRFLLNVPVFDRDEWDPAIGQLVGDFTNVVLLDVDIGAELPFDERARRIHARLVEHAARATYSGVEVIRDLARQRPGQGIVAPVVFTSVIGMGELFTPEFRDCFGTPVWVSSETPQVWLDHQIIESDGGLLLNFEFVEQLFPKGLIEAFIEGYGRIVDWLRRGSDHWRTPVPDLLPEAQRAVRDGANATAGPAPDGLLHTRFFEHAAAQPDCVALAWGDDGELSYLALAEKALSIAAALVERGVGPGAVVGVNAPRGVNQVAAALGVLAAGNTLLPLSIDQPANRRALILESARASAILTEALDQAWPDGPVVIAIEAALQSAPLVAPRPTSSDDVAYVIYTSGSTGIPKGVEVAHRAALNTIHDINERFGVTREAKVLAVSSLDFDLAIYDIFGLLSAGGALVLIDEDDRRDARRWLQLTTRRGVTIWNSVPALLDMLLIAAESANVLLPLRLVLVSGDWVGLDLPGRLERCTSSCRFVALGGASEASIWSNCFEVDRVSPHWRSIPYGFPLRNQNFRIVDRRGRDCPDFVPGELWIGGLGVARGYRNEPTLTAQQFVAWNGERWYRTGDRGCYWPDGTIEFLGRTDLQVKVRGHRIELHEIEAVLLTHPQVAKAVAIVVTQPVGLIAAAVVPRADAIDIRQLQAFAAERLPAYMVPHRILFFDALPVTANGKIDRRALEALASQPNAAEREEPCATATEVQVAALWSEFLKVSHIGRGDEFFALGGDSLLATRLLEAIDQRFGVRVPMRDFMINPTVADLASLVSIRAEQIEEGTI
jgi:amino acid adenylation domain-containing protein